MTCTFNVHVSKLKHSNNCCIFSQSELSPSTFLSPHSINNLILSNHWLNIRFVIVNNRSEKYCFMIKWIKELTRSYINELLNKLITDIAPESLIHGTVFHNHILQDRVHSYTHVLWMTSDRITLSTLLHVPSLQV